ncbi:MAG: PD-(D/E)XK nuclease family protein [Pleomorphochaeta sp.]
MNKQIVFNEFNANRVCVFHNEVIARNFAIEYAYKYGVIEAEKAISYDTFKQYFLPNHENLTEVNDQIREFFLIEFLENYKLKYMVNDKYPESFSRFTSYLINILKQVKRVQDCEVFSSLDSDFKDDINLLYKEYNDFLIKNNLFEPSFEDPSLNFAPKEVLEKQYSIIASDTKIGCKQFINKLENPKFIKLIEVEKIDSSLGNCENNSKLIRFDNSAALQNTLFRELKKLLDSSVLARDIAITLCNFDDDIQEIELGAKKYNIPISKSKGYSISKYPGGKYLLYLSNLYDNNFSLDDMKSFFLERSFPFENISFNRKFIRFAIDANIDHGSNKYDFDYWLLRLKYEPELLNFYKKFKNLVIKLNTIETISDLLNSLYSLERLLLKDNLGWINSNGEASYRFAIDKLEGLKNSMQACNVTKIKQIFKVYIRLLEKENYVEQGKRDGIRIFEYPLAASLDIPYHFVSDINAKNSEVIDKPLFVLPPSVEDQVLREEEDLTNNVIKDFCLNSGMTYFLFGETTYDGAQIAPSFFMERNSIVEPFFNNSYTPYIDELDLWESNSNKKLKLSSYQTEVLNKVKNNVLTFDENGYVNKKIEKEFNDFLLDRIKTKEGLLNFSATSINSFQNCPYAFAIKYLLGVDKNEYSVVQYAANEVGTIVHKIFELFFIRVMREDTQFYSANKVKYISWLDEIKEKEFEMYFKSEKSPPISTQIYIKDKYKDLASDFIDVEILKFNTCRSQEMENKYSSIEQIELNGNEYFYSLNGKIDRVVNVGNGDYAIVDYKTGKPPIGVTWHKKAFEEKRLDFPDYQFPCYKKLLNKKAMNVDIASYYSVSDSKYVDMWNSNTPEDKEDIDYTFDLVMKLMIEQILNGNFIATPSEDHCANCNYRQVCRKRYSTK